MHKKISCNETLVLTYPKFCAPLGTPATNSGDKNGHLEGKLPIPTLQLHNKSVKDSF